MNTEMYTDLFRFPLLLYRPSISAIVIAVGVSLASALLGSATAVQRAARLPPAQAMQPPAPTVFRKVRLWDTRAARWLDQPTRIIGRNIMRSPTRSALTMLGVTASIGLLVLAMQWNDSLDYLGQSYFFHAQHHRTPRSASPSRSLRRFCVTSSTCPVCWPSSQCASSAPTCRLVRLRTAVR